jgi:DnaJ-class molecular chaperone
VNLELQTITVLPGLCVCPLCLGSGKMAVNDTYLVTCWECNGKGHRYERTVTT